MQEYICYTDKGHWTFYADQDPHDALRLALFYCWRDDEIFDRVECRQSGKQFTLRLCMIDKTNSIQTL